MNNEDVRINENRQNKNRNRLHGLYQSVFQSMYARDVFGKNTAFLHYVKTKTGYPVHDMNLRSLTLAVADDDLQMVIRSLLEYLNENRYEKLAEQWNQGTSALYPISSPKTYS